MVNRTERAERCRDLNRGNPTAAPARSPDRDAPQFCSARASASNPLLYASFELAGHHGATSFLIWFQVLRSAASDHPCAGCQLLTAQTVGTLRTALIQILLHHIKHLVERKSRRPAMRFQRPQLCRG